MNKFKILRALIFYSFISINLYSYDKVITLFIQNYPTFKKPKLNDTETEQLSKKLKQPGYLVHQSTKSNSNFSNKASGIICLYAGMRKISNHNGFVFFPRKQQADEIFILVTKSIKPAYIFAPATIYDWLIDKSQPMECYKVTLKNDSDANYYFETTKSDVPVHSKNGNISYNDIALNTILIIGDPKSIYVPEGATLTDFSPNLNLPTMYVKKDFDSDFNALYNLAIGQYFRPLTSQFKQDDLSVLQIYE